MFSGEAPSSLRPGGHQAKANQSEKASCARHAADTNSLAINQSGAAVKVLVAGAARCGSTWAANVLGHAADTRTVYEPDGHNSDVLGAVAATRLGEYPVLEPGESSYWYRLIWDLAFAGGWPWDKVESARAAGRRLVHVPPRVRDYLVAGLAEGTRTVRPRPRNVVVKSVNSIFSLDWIAERYAPTVVILRRNPLNIVSSWLVLGMWTDHAIGNNALVRDRYLSPLGLQSPNGTSSQVRIAAWNVGLLTRALKDAADRHPAWIVASHDELCISPIENFQKLTDRIGLEWSDGMESYLTRSEDPGFTVHHGTVKVHPNAVTATTEGSRREQQATQFTRRLTPAQTAEAVAVLESFDLGDWGPRTL